MDSKHLPITSPCPIDLDAIGFDRTSRQSHCSHCDKNVHNLSRMTEREVRAFMKENAGVQLCVTYNRTPEGKVAFRPEPSAQLVPLQRLKRRPAAAAAGFGLAMALAACAPHGASDEAGGMSGAAIQEQVGGGKTGAPIEDRPAGGMMVKPEPCEPVEGELEPQPDPEPVEVMAGNMPVRAEETLDGEITAKPMVKGEVAIEPALEGEPEPAVDAAPAQRGRTHLPD